MTVEEVIAIAKTLRPGFCRYVLNITDVPIDCERYILVWRNEGRSSTGAGNTVEEALRNAGWKG